MAEFYRIAFAVFCWILAAVGIWSGSDLILEALRGEIGDRTNAIMGGAVFVIIGITFGWLAYGLTA